MAASSALPARKLGWLRHTSLVLTAVLIAGGTAAVAASKPITRSEPSNFAEVGPGAQWANTHQVEQDSETTEPIGPAPLPTGDSEDHDAEPTSASPEATVGLFAAQEGTDSGHWHLRVEPHRRRRQEHF